MIGKESQEIYKELNRTRLELLVVLIVVALETRSLKFHHFTLLVTKLNDIINTINNNRNNCY